MRYFDTVEIAYKYKPIFINYAKEHLSNKYHREDAVEEMFESALEFKNNSPEKKLSSFIMLHHLRKICRRYNEHEKIFK